MDDNLWTRLESMLKNYTNEDYANIGTNQLRERQAIRPTDTLSDFGYGPRNGLNVVTSPDMYFPPKMKENTKMDASLPYNEGGNFSILGSITLNPNSKFDKTSTLAHEAQHWKDAFGSSSTH